MLSKISNIHATIPPVPPVPPVPVPLGIYLDNLGAGGDGSESNPYGPFSEIPWATDIDNAVAADRPVFINLKKSTTWIEPLVIESTGTVAAPITVQPYSTGTDPRIVLTTLPNDYGVYMKSKSNIVLDGIEIHGKGFSNFHVEYPASNITIKNCTAEYSDLHGFYFLGDALSLLTNVDIIDCVTNTDIQDSGIDLRYVDGANVLRNDFQDKVGASGVRLFNSTNVTVEDNKIVAPPAPLGAILIDGLLSTNNEINRNYIGTSGVSTTNSKAAISFNADGGTNTVSLNVIADGQKFVTFYNSVGGNLLYNNSYYSDIWAVYSTGTAGNTLKNNIIFAESLGDLARASVTGYTGYVWEDNIWWNTIQIGDLYTWNGGKTWAEWNSVLSYDTTGLFADPKYTLPASGDLTLQAGSPAITGAEAISGYSERLHPSSVWPSNVTTMEDPDTVGAYGYV